MCTSSKTIGGTPLMICVATSFCGVAQATFKAMPPTTVVAKAPAKSRFHRDDLMTLKSRCSDLTVNMASLLWPALEWRDIAIGAQTKRRSWCRAGEELSRRLGAHRPLLNTAA